MALRILIVLCCIAPAGAWGQATRPMTAPATRPVVPPSRQGGGLMGALFGTRRPTRPPPPAGMEGVPENLKEQLGATDEEWKVINPLLRKIILARRALEPEGYNPFGMGPRDRFWESGNPLPDAKKELQTALDDRNAPPELIREKLQILRTERNKARAQLQEMETDLKDLLMPAQEALMVQLGYLE